MGKIESDFSKILLSGLKENFNSHYGEHPDHLGKFPHFNEETSKMEWIDLPEFLPLFTHGGGDKD